MTTESFVITYKRSPFERKYTPLKPIETDDFTILKLAKEFKLNGQGKIQPPFHKVVVYKGNKVFLVINGDD